MSSGEPIRLAAAELLANGLIHALAPDCEIIRVAGSIRRRKVYVHDIEICAVPKFSTDLLGGKGESLLDIGLERLLFEQVLLPGRCDGSKYKNFIHCSGAKVDLFITTPEKWPVIFAIRTGPKEFSHKLVTQKCKGGLLPSSLSVREGRVLDIDGIPYVFKDEKAFLKSILGEWIEPEDRR